MMKAQIIDGKALALSIRANVAEKAAIFERDFKRKIGLAVVMVGDNAASKIYVKNKIAACEKAGVNSLEYVLPAQTSQAYLENLVEKLNLDKNVDGILVQLPLPNHINEKEVLAKILPQKDVDGFHAINAGNLMLGNPCLAACTPSGIIELIKSTGVEIKGKNAVVVGRSNIVGKPIAMMLLANDATVTVCHSKTENLKEHTQNADILVVAIGKREFITGDMIKEGAVVVDVGMNREDGKLFGDVNFAEASEKASFITPVPGGVGPMTIAMLLDNTVKAAYRAK